MKFVALCIVICLILDFVDSLPIFLRHKGSRSRTESSLSPSLQDSTPVQTSSEPRGVGSQLPPMLISMSKPGKKPKFYQSKTLELLTDIKEFFRNVQAALKPKKTKRSEEMRHHNNIHRGQHISGSFPSLLIRGGRHGRRNNRSRRA